MLRTLAAPPPRTSLNARRARGPKLTDRLAICPLLPPSVVDDRAAGRQQDFYDNGTPPGVGANARQPLPASPPNAPCRPMPEPNPLAPNTASPAPLTSTPPRI